MEEYIVFHLGFDNPKFGRTGETSQSLLLMHNLIYRDPNRIILDVLETLGCLLKHCSFGRNLILALEGCKLTNHYAASYGGGNGQLVPN